MRVITLNYDPLDCTCWFPGSSLYCEYCDSVCDAALADFEAGVGDWTIVGASDEYSEAEEAAHAAALAEFFEEGSTPEEFWDTPESGLSALTNYMSSFPEGEAPWRSVRPSRSSASKTNRKQKSLIPALPFVKDRFCCSCSSISSELYCAYCNIVCDHALFDFEADIGQWVFFGRSDFSVSEEARCWVALDQLYREERPITPPPVPPRSPSPDPFQALLDDPPEVDIPWSVPRPPFCEGTCVCGF
ncbi:hypothetical protein RhiLY_09190 [Ceratobasidium sp. AG-Ba]|nr:hypothetical protein RhiLY_09190 [Ceratobasidium sp. AG-Ba]